MNKKTFKYIKETFLNLTKKTYPYGDELDLKEEGLLLDCLEEDQFGNFFVKIGESRSIFASHLDTVGSIQEDIIHVIDKDEVVRTDGHTILGADDKSGVVLMYWMIKHKIPGLYYFFVGEEVGCFGSGQVSSYEANEIKGNYDRIISFDRKGTDSIITFQSSYRTCSEDFSKALAKELNVTKGFKYKSDNTGSYTDAAEFTSLIPECTNLSVGYYAQHTNSERQDLKHLAKLADALLTVNWESLPAVRDITKKESKYNYNQSYNRGSYQGGYINSRNHAVQNRPNGCRSDNGYFGNDFQRTGKVGTYPPRSFEEEESEYEYVFDHESKQATRRKKTRRGGTRNRSKGELFYANGKNVGRRFISSGSELVEIFDEPDTSIANKGTFDSVKEKLLLSNMTRQEAKNVKEQYLEASLTKVDRDFAKVLQMYQLGGDGL